MMYFGMPGIFEMLTILLMGSGGGLPLGMPPAAEDPVMSRVAPEQCLFYLSWAGMATPDPNSPNHTEQLLAEKEIQEFVAQIERRVMDSIKREAGRDPEAAAMIDEVHLVVKTVLTSPTAVFVSNVDFAAGAPDFRAGAVVNLGDRAGEVEKALKKMEAAAFGGEVAEIKGEGTTWRALPMPQEAPPIVWDIKGKYLIVGVGRGEADATYARARTEPPKWLADLREQLAVERPASVVYFNVADVLKMAGPFMGREGTTIVEALGLSNIRSLGSVTGLDGADCVTKGLIAVDGPLTGLLSVFTGEPLSPEDLAAIPKDSTLAAAARFDLAAAYKTLLEVTGRIEPRAREELLDGVQEMEEAMEIKLAEDIFSSVGDVWRVYNSPSEGGLVVTGLTAVVDLKDRDRLVAANAKLVLGKLAQEAVRRMREGGRRRGAMISQFKHGEQTVFFLNVIGEEFPLAPAWCITDKELVVALFPQNVKAYLSRAGGPAAGSLADVPEVAKLWAGGRAPLGLTYHDTPELFKLVYPVVQIVAQMACGEMQREGIDIDVSILPSAPSILRHLRPGTSTVRRTETGILIESRQTLPVGDGGAITMPMFFMLGVAAQTGIEELVEPIAEATIPATAQTRSMNNLKQIVLAMHNYDAAFRHFPASAGPMKKGQPPVSWRVLVLPYIEEGLLYDQYRLDEPWDSDNNKKLISRMPAVYKAPRSKVAERGMTNYQVVVGEGMAFSADKPSRIAEFRDGTSNTIMAVEVADSKAVPWTKPADFTPDKKNPVAGLLGLRRGGFLAAFTDGAVRFVPGGIDAKTLYALFTRDGGEVAVDRDWIDQAPRSRPPAIEMEEPAEAEEVPMEKPEPVRRPVPPKRRFDAPQENAP